jgi:peptide/nickel transport system substrate-binding protein
MRTRRYSRLLGLTGLGAAVAVTVAACGGSSAGSSSSGGSGGSPATSASANLRIVAAEPQSGLDPNTAVTDASRRVMELIYDNLLDYDKGGKLVGDIAQSWTASADGRSYTFKLQPKAQFSDGSPITAQDVVFSIERAAKGDAMKASLADMKSITAVDPHTVRIDLHAKSRVFLNGLARAGNSAILSQKAVEGNGNYFSKPTATSGPWTLDTYTPKDRATLSANPHYYKTGLPRIKQITYTFTDDPTSAAAALESDTDDMYFPMAPNDAKRLQQEGKVNVYAPPSPGVLIWGLNKTKPPFNDVRVRQAFAYLVPRQDRLTACWDGIGGVSYGSVILPGEWAYSPGLDKYKVSKQQAQSQAAALLDAAGWKDQGGTRKAQGVPGVADGTPLKVTVPFENNWDQARCNTQLLKSDLAPAGIDIQPQAYDAATFYGDVAKGKFTMFHAGDGWATVDDEMQQAFTSDGQANSIIAQWKNPQVDKLIAAAGATSDLASARKDYQQAQQIILDQVPAIVTGAQYSVVATTIRMHGYYGRADNSNRALIEATITS